MNSLLFPRHIGCLLEKYPLKSFFIEQTGEESVTVWYWHLQLKLMIYQIIVTHSYFSMVNLPSWYLSVESMSLAIFGALVILLSELLLMFLLLNLLMAGGLLYQVIRMVSSALRLCLQYRHHLFELTKIHWCVHRSSLSAPRIT